MRNTMPFGGMPQNQSQNMHPMARLFQMKQMGYSDDQILQEMAKNNPRAQSAISQMNAQNMSVNDYVAKIASQNGMTTQQYFQHLAQQNGMQVPPMGGQMNGGNMQPRR